MTRRLPLLVFCAALAGCAAPQRTSSPTVVPPSNPPATAPPASSDPEPRVGVPETVSRAAGEPGGVVILWPRIIPRSAGAQLRDVATALQAQLRSAVGEALPGRPMDMRPEPERSCPQGGCKGIAVGVLLLNRGPSCVALALTRPAGMGPATITPWRGQVKLKTKTVAFRSPPESAVVITDFAKCRELAKGTPETRAAMVAAIKAALAAPAP